VASISGRLAEAAEQMRRDRLSIDDIGAALAYAADHMSREGLMSV
jgi:hypothetical protein